MPDFDAVLFDLDGTLLYTLPDMAAALNHALTVHGCPTHPLEAVRGFVGNGVRKLIARAIPGGEDNPLFPAVWQEYNEYYAVHWQDRTAPYPGIPELLDALTARGIRTGVVTNKTHSDAEPMIRRYFGDRMHTEGKKEGRPTKPAPDSVIDAMAALGASPARTLYVGDTGVDAETAANAAIPCVLVCWGYWDEDRLTDCAALARIHRPEELLNYV